MSIFLDTKILYEHNLTGIFLLLLCKTVWRESPWASTEEKVLRHPAKLLHWDGRSWQKLLAPCPTTDGKKINKSSNTSALSSLLASHNPYSREKKITWPFWGFRRDPADVGEEVHVLLCDHLGDVREALCFFWILRQKLDTSSVWPADAEPLKK